MILHVPASVCLHEPPPLLLVVSAAAYTYKSYAMYVLTAACAVMPASLCTTWLQCTLTLQLQNGSLLIQLLSLA